MVKDSLVSVKSLFSARAFFRDPIETARSQDSGAALTRLAVGPGRYVLVRDPDAIWRVLVTDGPSFRQGKWKRRSRRYLGDSLNTLDGAEHRERRSVIQGSTARRRVDSLAPLMAARVDAMQSSWRDGARLVLRDELDPLCLCIAGDVLLSTDLEPQAGELAAALVQVVRGVPRLTPPLRATRHGRAMAYATAAIDALTAERRAGAGPDDDLLGSLLSAELPDHAVRGDVLACLMAAVDEPTVALESAWRLLGGNPAAEQRLLAEIDLALDGRQPGLDDLVRLPYLGAVLDETLRLCPPARHVDRCPAQDVRIAGETVRAGTNVIVSPLVTHHEARLHPDPERFEPERWLDAEECRRRGERGAYIPFGAGVHTCIGEPLARATMSLTLASVAQRWRLRSAEPALDAQTGRLMVELERR